MNKINLKWLNTVQLQLDDILEKEKLWTQQKIKQMSMEGGG